ncbi:DUF397 domain-containing protein [Nonomuraea sp. NPDC003214]
MTMNDLYSRRVAAQGWRRLCGGNQQEEDGESCVQIAPLEGVEDAFALSDSKNPAAGTLRFTGAELRAAGIDTTI